MRKVRKRQEKTALEPPKFGAKLSSPCPFFFSEHLKVITGVCVL
jgi:hypothetical protein